MLVIWTPFAAALAGFFFHRMAAVVPWSRFADALTLAIVVTAFAWGLRRATRWSWPTSMLFVWIAALLFFVGPLPVLGAVLLGAAAVAIGTWIVPDMPARPAIAAVTGLLLIAGVGDWLLTLPVHYPLTCAAVLSLPIAMRARQAKPGIKHCRNAWRDATHVAPRWAAFAVMLLGLASTACWLPTIQADDLAYHLRLPAQLVFEHRYDPAPEQLIWALSPWANDTLHGIVSVLAGTIDSRGALNALWLVLIGCLTWAFASTLGADPRARWAAVAVSSSVPMLAGLAGSMHTELGATAALLSIATLTMAAPRNAWIALAIVFAGLPALKPMHLLSALPLLALFLWRYRRAWQLRACIAVMGVFVGVAASSYVHAWVLTGNPVLPLFNGVFASPFAPTGNFDDVRWHSGLDIGLPWHLVFDTTRYLESGQAALDSRRWRYPGAG